MVTEDQISSMVLRVQEARASGAACTVEDLCDAPPELLAEVKRRLAQLDRFGSLGAAESSDPQSQQTTQDQEVLAAEPPPSTAASRLVGLVPGYEILCELGHGGMGIVYKARQLGFNRIVALKMVRAGAAAEQAERFRFRIEAEAVARMRHANIVQVHDIGEADGCPYFSMEYLAGGSLSERTIAERQAPEWAAKVVEALALAIHHVHEAGVIHRDLKPSNVILDADGTPKLTDFGLAKLLDADATRSASESILGTISYMAPEQAAGRSRDIGTLTDIYGLGAILYALLTGQPPVERGPWEVMLERVRTQEPVPPRRLRPELSPDLEAVCLKCLNKDPRRRYPDARALAEDLRRWQEGRPTIARPLSLASRLGRWVRRHPLTSTATALFLAAVLVVPLAAYHFDPERVPKDNLAQVARGHRVVLIGENGPPRWWKCVLGTPEIVEPPGGGKTFSFSSRNFAYLELMPRGPATGYRFRIKIKDEEKGNGAGGTVGLYCLRSEFATAQGIEHGFCAIRFSDWHQLGEDRAGKPTGRLSLTIRRRRVPGRYLAEHSTDLAQSIPLARPRPGPPPIWHEVVVVVTEASLQLSWDGGPFRAVARPPLAQTFQEELNSIQDTAIHEPALSPSFLPTGGLGIFVENGWASFRDAVVEPLDDLRGQ